MACEYDTFLLCHSSRYLGLERRTVEQASEGGKERGAGVRGGGGHPAGGGPGRREGEGGAGVRVGRVVHLEGGGGGGGRRGAGHGREGERGAVGDEQAVVVGQRRRARGRSVHRHRAGESQWN